MNTAWVAILVAFVGQRGPSELSRAEGWRPGACEATSYPSSASPSWFDARLVAERLPVRTALSFTDRDACELEDDDEARSTQLDLLGFSPADWLTWKSPVSTGSSGPIPLFESTFAAFLPHLRC